MLKILLITALKGFFTFSTFELYRFHGKNIAVHLKAEKENIYFSH